MALPELRAAYLTEVRHTIEVPSNVLYAGAHQPSASGADFRQALSRLAAGTSIITTYDQDGNKLGMTATAVTSVSLDPPLVLVCVDNRTRTAAALTAGAPFVAQFLGADQEALARQFARPIADKFAGVAYQVTPNGCPRLEGVLASVECFPYQIVPSGDHTIVVGRVIEVQVADKDSSPLIYFRSQFLKHSGAEV
jgi:flavin reductase ActVB